MTQATWLALHARSLTAVALFALLLAPAPAQQAPQSQGQQGRQQVKAMLLPQAVVLPVGDRKIDIDGSLIDWPKLPAMQLNDPRQLSGTRHGAWYGRADASAVVFMMWGEEGLYIACTALDQWHRELDAKTLALTEIPAADSLVLSFDPDRNTRANGPDPGRREDREFWLADETAREVVQWDRLRGAARMLPRPARMVVLHDKEQGLTTYEALIPWPEILPPGKQPQVGKSIDLQMILNDFDEVTDSMPQTRIGWTFGMGPVVDPGLLGTIQLVGNDAPMRGIMPEFPAKPGGGEAPAEPREYWRELSAQFIQNPPAVYDGMLTPEETGGIKRLRALEALDQHYARMPRVDNLEILQRVHRRMSREVAGLTARGLPSWWRERTHSISKQAEDAVPAGSMRLFRLPMGGWVVRCANKSFMIDAAGPDVDQWLWGAAQMCVLTQPLAMERRNDQLLLRMLMADPVHPVMTHIVFHLPVIAMEKIPLMRLGKPTSASAGVTVRGIGTAAADGSVPFDLGYRVQASGCPDLVIVGPTTKIEDVEAKPVGVLIASSRNRGVVEIAKKLKPGITLFDDGFLPETNKSRPRVTMKHLHQLQRALLPLKSVVLAPGESWTVGRDGD
jgi:hypothetical protein